MRTVKEALEDGSLSLEDEIDYADMTEEDYKKEIERLSIIINELEKWLIIQHDIYKNVDKEENTRLSCQYLKVKDKLQELKRSGSNE